MENINVIDLHQTRDFGKKMNATFEFVKQNFKGLAKSTLFIAGPPILIASLLMSSFMDDVMSMTMRSAMGNLDGINYFLSPVFWLQLLLLVLFFIISGVATIATVNNYIILYDEKKTNQIEVDEVWQRVRATFFMYLGSVILFTILAVAAYLLIIIPVVLAASISPVLSVLGVMIMLVLFFYLFIGTSLTFFIQGYERKTFFASLGRSLKLTQGKWWSTFGLLFLLYLIAGTISSVFFIPWYIMFITTMMHTVTSGAVAETSTTYQVVSMILLTLYYLSQMVLYAFPYVGIAFQYFNLVEMKESRGLMNQIDSFGQSQTTAPENEDY